MIDTSAIKTKSSSTRETRIGDLVEVTGTGTSRFLRKGAKTIVHKVAAETLVAQGKATIGKPVEGGKNRARKD